MRLAIVLLLAIARPLWAEGSREVDVELFLAVDVSRSMAPAEQAIQRQGYAAALRSNEVVNAITGGLIGEIALTYVEWSGERSQRVVIPWTRIGSREDAEAFASRIEAEGRTALWRTSISAVLTHASVSISGNKYEGLRRVIDISGDGPNNQGIPVIDARDYVIAQGITINGLPLMTRDGLWINWHLEDLDEYYQYCVIGGPGAFSIPVHDWADFATAVKRKLVLEIAGIHPGPALIRAQYYGMTKAGYDCLIGERIWRDNRRNYGTPPPAP